MKDGHTIETKKKMKDVYPNVHMFKATHRSAKNLIEV